MSCSGEGATHHVACDCRESAWAEKLAAAEERAEKAEALLNGGMRDRAVAAEERARRLEEALRKIDMGACAGPCDGGCQSIARAALVPTGEERGK